ncbi:multidrug transporter [Microbacterium saccharophilum]|uniref:Multidrug transporter n=1 Tax=Microbacterium saccharophilum TaxID=1213358 RepID=A0A5C8I179_9MICO|nr:multidrug transporter [Microbacterium saccharophilum]TXK11459.1 multidrug transporter [Microbacterium saccharophilum]GEP48493.1 hypothetical protein MSA03_20010 [Microbacterium saccharophilum]
MSDTDGMTDEEKRRDQLLRAEGSTERDAAPRIEVSEHDGNTRIDIAEDAVVRPGPGPGVAGADDDEAAEAVESGAAGEPPDAH